MGRCALPKGVRRTRVGRLHGGSTEGRSQHGVFLRNNMAKAGCCEPWGWRSGIVSCSGDSSESGRIKQAAIMHMYVFSYANRRVFVTSHRVWLALLGAAEAAQASRALHLCSPCCVQLRRRVPALG